MGAGTTDEQSASLEIKNRLGLHARAAVLLVKTAEKFDADISIAKDGQVVNGRSIMGVMMLAAGVGNTITLRTDGDDEEAAMNEMAALFERKFDEGA